MPVNPFVFDRVQQERAKIRENNVLPEPETERRDYLDPELDRALTLAEQGWKNQDKAIAAGILGAPADLVQLGGDALAGALVAQRPEIPFTTEDLRERFGVEGGSMDSFLGGLLSPEPTSTYKALLLPMGYIRRGGEAADKLYKAAVQMFKDGADPGQIYRATGAIKAKNGEILWHKRDTGTIRADTVRSFIEEQHPNLGAGKQAAITVRPRDILEGDDELFEMFPYLDNMTVRLHVKNKGTLEDPKYIYFNEAQAKRGGRGGVNYRTGEIDLYSPSKGAAWNESAASTLYHEMGHQIDAVMGVLPTGGSMNQVTQSYSNLKFNQAALELMDDIDSGRYIDDWMNAGEGDADFLMDVLEGHGLSPDDTKGLRSLYISYANSVETAGDDVTAQILRSNVERSIAREKTTMGTVMSQTSLDAQNIDPIFDVLDEGTLQDLASDRYFRLEGEFRQRLNQYLRNKSDEQVDTFLERYARTGQPPRGMDQPVAFQNQIVEAPVEVDPARFAGARGGAGSQLEEVSPRYRQILDEFPDITPDRIEKNIPAAAALDDGINDVYMSSTAFGTQTAKKRVEVLKNPSSSEIKRWAAKYFKENLPDPDEGPLVRVITDVEGNHYIWPANDALHDDFLKKTGIVAHWGDDWTDVDGIDPMELVNMKEKGFNISELDNYRPD